MHPVIRKLSVFASFSPEEELAIELVCSNSFEVAAQSVVAREDEAPTGVFFLLEGFMCRHKLLPSGGRQILSFAFPGDSCDIGVTLLERRDYSLTTLTPAVLARISDWALDDVCTQHPKIRAALQWATIVDEAVSREWILNLGRRDATSRLAHLFCELYYRSESLGLAKGHGYELPVTQTDLGDAIAVSSIHVNRILHELRAQKLIAFGDKRVTILDLARLEQVAEFRRTYLHLDASYAALEGDAEATRPRGSSAPRVHS